MKQPAVRPSQGRALRMHGQVAMPAIAEGIRRRDDAVRQWCTAQWPVTGASGLRGQARLMQPSSTNAARPRFARAGLNHRTCEGLKLG